MNRRDQELLDKQFRRLNTAPRSDGVIIILTIIAVFLAGIAIGDVLSAATGEAPLQVAANDVPPAIAAWPLTPR